MFAFTFQKARVCFSLTIIAVNCFCAISQNIKFDRIGTVNGLTQANVSAISQDELGFVWLGTEDGLNRFNGYTIETFLHDSEDSLSLPHNRISRLVRGKNGNMWVASGEGLALYEYTTNSFRIFNIPDTSTQEVRVPQGGITGLDLDKNGNIWVATYASLSKIAYTDRTVTNYFYNLENTDTGLPANIIFLTEDDQNALWVANTTTIAKLNPTTGEITRLMDTNESDSPLAGMEKISGLLIDNKNRLWVGSINGLLLYDIRNESYERFRYDPSNEETIPDNLIADVLQNSNGQVWIGTDNGIAIYLENGQFRRLKHNPNNNTSIGSNITLTMYEDDQDRVWIGSRNGGVSYNDPGKFSFDIYKSQGNNSIGLNSNQVTGFSEDAQGNIYVATDGGGLNYLDLATNQFSHLKHDKYNPNTIGGDKVLSVVVDQNQQVWAGMWNGGVSAYNPKTGVFKNYRHDPYDPRSLQGNNIFTVVENSKGQIMIGVWQEGLSIFQPSTDDFINLKHDPENSNSIPDGTIALIEEDENGTYWIGSDYGGIARLNQNFEVTKTYQKNDGSGLSSSGIMELFIDSKYRVWVGTYGNGLNLFNKETNTFKTYTTKDGLVNNVILNILEDDRGYLWITTNRGMSRFDVTNETFTNFYREDGLQDNQFLPRSGLKTSNGNLIFGGVGGFNLFDPLSMNTNEVAPRVYITSMSLYNQPVTPGPESILQESITFTEELTLNYDQDLFSFEFLGVSFRHANKNRYRYLLEGLHNDWVDNGTERKVSFMNLAPGGYTLKIDGANNDGVWSNAPATLNIYITPPFWATWWFRLIVIVIVITSIYVVIKKRADKNKEQKRILEEKVREATEKANIQNSELQAQSSKLKEAIEETNFIVKEAVDSGNFTARIETENKEGEWKKLGESVNQLFESVLNPFQEINLVVDHLSVGDLTQRFTAEARGDVKVLANNLNQAIDNLTTLINDVTNQVLHIRSASTEMLTTNEEMNVSTNEIASAISEMNRGSQDQLVKVDQASDLMEAVLRFAAVMSEQAESIHSAAKEGVNESNEGTVSISRLDDSMQEILDYSKQTNHSIQNLSKSSDDISSVLNIIKEIAAQTNLLALNAAIEAAQAGEAGRGFSVVAEEIRKLAEDSKKSVGEIEELVSNVQHETYETANLVVAMSERIKEGEEATKTSLQTFKSISAKYEDTLGKSDEILKATKRQSDDVSNIVNLISSIVVIAEETAAGTEEVASSSSELAAGMENYILKNRDVTAITDDLTDKVNKFKLE